MSEALVAIVAGEDPVPAVRRYLAAERAWLMRTAPLLDHRAAATRRMSLLTAAARWVQAMLQEEPVLTLAVVQSGVAMLVGFGLAWSGEQVGLVVGFSAAVLGWIARSQVTPEQPGGAMTHPCPGCLRVTSRPGRCVACGGGTTTQRGYGADWQTASGAAAAAASGVRVEASG